MHSLRLNLRIGYNNVSEAAYFSLSREISNDIIDIATFKCDNVSTAKKDMTAILHGIDNIIVDAVAYRLEFMTTFTSMFHVPLSRIQADWVINDFLKFSHRW